VLLIGHQGVSLLHVLIQASIFSSFLFAQPSFLQNMTEHVAIEIAPGPVLKQGFTHSRFLENSYLK
jgi:hypothetical protein